MNPLARLLEAALFASARPIPLDELAALDPDASPAALQSALDELRETYDNAGGYPGLVVHGPLLATLLLEALHRHVPGTEVGRFEFRAHRPLFDTAEFAVEGKPDGEGWALWATDALGNVAVEASVHG